MHEYENIEPEFLKRLKTNPFRTPDNYFESIEETIMGNIEHRTKKQANSTVIARFLLPALGLVASLTLIYLLVYSPINILPTKTVAKTEVTDSIAFDLANEYSINLSSIDDDALVNAIFADDANNVAKINPSEVLAYLSSNLNDVEIYSEIQN